MHSTRKILTWAAGLIVLGFLAGASFIYSGVYNIAADDHHTVPVAAVIGTLRNRSIQSQAKSVEAVLADDPKRTAAGATEYAEMCVSCHSAPGIAEESEIRQGLYPRPPNLAKDGIRNPKEAFWVIKHGIKMSGMPAWGPTHDDATIWNIIAFLIEIPDMSPEEYRKISAGEGGHVHAGHLTSGSGDSRGSTGRLLEMSQRDPLGSVIELGDCSLLTDENACLMRTVTPMGSGFTTAGRAAMASGYAPVCYTIAPSRNATGFTFPAS